MDTLVLGSWFRLLRPIADFHRLANTHAGRTQKRAALLPNLKQENNFAMKIKLLSKLSKSVWSQLIQFNHKTKKERFYRSDSHHHIIFALMITKISTYTVKPVQHNLIKGCFTPHYHSMNMVNNTNFESQYTNFN